MGLDQHGVRFLLHARAAGVNFSRSLMVGRQSVHLRASELYQLCRRLGHPQPLARCQALLEESAYAEPLLRLLGASDVQSLDASSYEGASLVHDLNLPLPPDLRERFSMVLDGGSLEHVFDFPRALSSCLELVAVGGHFLSISPANNAMGHGFYQFSPELWCRIFQPEHGFSLERLWLFENVPGGRWFEVADPQKARARVELINAAPTYLLIQARKLKTVTPLFSPAPQQSDYASAWGAPAEPQSQASSLRARLGTLLPETFHQRLAWWRTQRRLNYPSSSFRRLKK